MAHLEVNVSDTAGFEDDPNGGGIAPYRQDYEVVTELFKRGRTWEAGEHIDLDPETAARLIETGDLKEIDA